MDDSEKLCLHKRKQPHINAASSIVEAEQK